MVERWLAGRRTKKKPLIAEAIRHDPEFDSFFQEAKQLRREVLGVVHTVREQPDNFDQFSAALSKCILTFSQAQCHVMRFDFTNTHGRPTHEEDVKIILKIQRELNHSLEIFNRFVSYMLGPSGALDGLTTEQLGQIDHDVDGLLDDLTSAMETGVYRTSLETVNKLVGMLKLAGKVSETLFLRDNDVLRLRNRGKRITAFILEAIRKHNYESTAGNNDVQAILTQALSIIERLDRVRPE